MPASTNKTVSSFPIESEYTRCVTALSHAGILPPLSKSARIGVTGQDGKEYPVPSQAQVLALFDTNIELIDFKIAQGFDRLELTPLAMPMQALCDCLKTAVIRHAAAGKIYETRRSPADPLIPVHVNKEKQVWIWETLKQALITDKLVYFPQEYSNNHRGLTKPEIINNDRICAVPGWSVGLIESAPMMPGQGQGKTLSGRKQPEIGLSPNEYLQALQSPPYRGETGKTLEDFMINFLTRLETTGEVSNDIADNNAVWCLGQYLKITYADVVPTGRWYRSIGRVRLDMHRSNNKECTKSWGAATVVRLSRPQK